MIQLLRKKLIFNLVALRRKSFTRYTMFNFVKKYWFYICIVLLLLLGYYRDSFRVEFGAASKPIKERYIDKAGTTGTGASFFGLFGSKPKLHPFPDTDEASTKAFLLRFGKVTQGEQTKFGIPASALLALSYVNSFAGNRALAKDANNFFALPCGEAWAGAHVSTDEQCYRQYETAWAGFRDASQALMAQEWVTAQIEAGNKDWKKWVALFVKHNHSDVKDAEAIMLRTIKAYRLYELDQGTPAH